MITGFDKETAPLTDYERDTILPVVCSILKTRFGCRASITSKRMITLLDGYKLSDARVRKIVNHIRNNDLVPCLIANSDGYYVAQSNEEMMTYEESLLGREEAIRAVRQAMERQRKSVYGDGQLTLF